MKNYIIEPCYCCQHEHHNRYGWIIRNIGDGPFEQYHVNLSSKPAICRLPDPPTATKKDGDR